MQWILKKKISIVPLERKYSFNNNNNKFLNWMKIWGKSICTHFSNILWIYSVRLVSNRQIGNWILKLNLRIDNTNSPLFFILSLSRSFSLMGKQRSFQWILFLFLSWIKISWRYLPIFSCIHFYLSSPLPPSLSTLIVPCVEWVYAWNAYINWYRVFFWIGSSPDGFLYNHVDSEIEIFIQRLPSLSNEIKVWNQTRW